MKLSKKKLAIVEDWIHKHGACSFDFESKDVILGDGGLFSIEKKKVKRQKVSGYKKLPTGGMQVIFSKKTYPDEDLEAWLWIEELEETILYFQSMKRMLNKIGVRTGWHKQ